MVFPEGTTTNGTHLMGFKRGAFNYLKTVRPVYLKYTHAGFSTDYSLFDLLPLIILNQCWIGGGLKCELGVLPDFQPTEFMFKKYADKGKERWEVYAWCVREAMSRASGLKTTDLPNRVKIAYWKHLCGNSAIDDFENKTIDEIVEAYNQIES